MTSQNRTLRRPDFDVVHFKGEYATKVGAAWNSESGKAINVVLDLLPPDGKLTLVEPRRKGSPPAAA